MIQHKNMITVTREILNYLVAYSTGQLPVEACGYLAGIGRLVTKVYPLTNIDYSPEHYAFDPVEQFRALKEARNDGLQIIACFHSHPHTPARPSSEDIRLAHDPEISYVIISLENTFHDIRSYKIRNGIAENEEIVIV